MNFTSQKLAKQFIKQARRDGYTIDVALNASKDEMTQAINTQYVPQNARRTQLKNLAGEATKEVNNRKIKKIEKEVEDNKVKYSKQVKAIKDAFKKNELAKENDKLRVWKVIRFIPESVNDGVLNMLVRTHEGAHSVSKYFKNVDIVNFENFNQRFLSKSVKFLQDSIEKLGTAVKVQMVFHVVLHRVGKRASDRTHIFNAEVMECMNIGDAEELMLRQVEDVSKLFDKGEYGPSDLSLRGISKVIMKIDSYTPFAGGSYIQSPDILKNKGVVNVKTTNEECFKFACFASLYTVKN